MTEQDPESELSRVITRRKLPTLPPAPEDAGPLLDYELVGPASGEPGTTRLRMTYADIEQRLSCRTPADEWEFVEQRLR